MKTTHQTTVYPQTVEIPEPLEVHPSVDPELARGLIAAVEYIEQHPLEFKMTEPYFSSAGKGCLICHAEKLSNWRRSLNDYMGAPASEIPIGHWARIFWPQIWEAVGYASAYDNLVGRFGRISLFISTGQ